MTSTHSNVVAVLLAGVGVVLLYLAWKGRAKPASLIAGWGALCLAVVVAFVVRGDRAVAEVLALAMTAVALVLTFPSIVGLFRAPAPAARARKLRASAASAPVARRKSVVIGAAVWTFLLVGPVAGIASLYAAAALYKVLRSDVPAHMADVSVLSVVVGLFLWATLTTVLLMERRLTFRTAYGLGAAGVAAAFAFI